jgi:hypothetical protein
MTFNFHDLKQFGVYFLGKPVSSTIQHTISPCFCMAGITIYAAKRFSRGPGAVVVPTKQFYIKLLIYNTVVLDGCYGTSGLAGVRAGGGVATARAPAGPSLQFFAAPSDDEYAMESSEAGGGVFTRALVRVLDSASKNETPLGMGDVVTALVRS